MKRQIRRGVFETNSSSVHSLTMCSAEEYEKWKNKEVLFWKERDKFGTREEIIAELKTIESWHGGLWYANVDWENEDEVHDVFSDEGIMTYDYFFEDYYYETYSYNHTTPSGDKIVAFGYYGHD